ncbi:lymphocyte activation gene 3 protein-like [Scomber scombrus]|uniref:Lymphocyte activation gene 3 protein-like n=1 Tax=Scomber scombrus TaxID=13677 RepID=A0AAV1P4T0_SCOSC|nr:lymphocyte activation gene 3 protein-like [Scomber scombrus]
MLLEYFIFGLITFLMTGAQCEVTEVFAEAGSQAVLPCKCNPSASSPPAILWTQVNKGTVWRKLKSGLQYWGSSWTQKGVQRVRCPHSQFERNDFSLQINSVTEEDGGVYSCLVQHKDNSVENVVILRVIRVSVSSAVPISGDDLSITCKVTPWPSGAKVQWKLNNSPFYITVDRDTDKSVVMQKATRRLSGNWTCIVSYKGKEGRASASLSVKGIMQPPKDNTKLYAAVGSAVTLPCVFAPGLNPFGSEWEKLKSGTISKTALGQLPPSFSLSSQSSRMPWDKSARVEEVGYKDEGSYRCSGTIRRQKVTRTMQLVVAKIDSSTPSKTKAAVTLTCQLTDASDVTDYEWVRVTYDINGTQSVGPIQKGKTISISRESDEKWGEWACRFYGKEGILGNITYHVPLMAGLTGQKSKGLSHNTTAVAGLSILLVVLLLILVQMFKNHQRRKRIFQYPALETIVHTISNEREERERNQVKN